MDNFFNSDSFSNIENLFGWKKLFIINYQFLKNTVSQDDTECGLCQVTTRHISWVT